MIRSFFVTLALALAFAAAPSRAQGLAPIPPVNPVDWRGAFKSFSGFSYAVGFPTGKTSDFVSNESWLNFTIEWHQMLKPRISAGIQLGYSELYEHTSGVYEVGNVAISGQQYRNLLIFPMLANLRIWLGDGHDIHPFFGLSMGAYYTQQYSVIGIRAEKDYFWHFGVAPELGVTFKLSPWMAAALTVRQHLLVPVSGYTGSPDSFGPSYFTGGISLYYRR